MAVFTQVTQQDLKPVIEQFSLGSVVLLEGIGAGIENTNYFLNTSKNGQLSRWVLTIFEAMESAELPFFVSLTQHLASKGLAVPAALQDSKGHSLFKIQGKDAMIVPCFEGAAKTDMEIEDCAAAGIWLAHMHHAAADFDGDRKLVRDSAWMQEHLNALRNSDMPRDDFALLEECVERYSVYRRELDQCSRGTVHGDLFKDNVLFVDENISGVIDFYHACTEGFLFDLAVCANDWAMTASGRHDSAKLSALVTAYQSEKPWSDAESACWPLFLELAALRFWISRLVSKYLTGYQQESLAGDTIKDPNAMRDIIIQLRA